MVKVRGTYAAGFKTAKATIERRRSSPSGQWKNHSFVQMGYPSSVGGQVYNYQLHWEEKEDGQETGVQLSNQYGSCRSYTIECNPA
jgi:hypothetical protein